MVTETHSKPVLIGIFRFCKIVACSDDIDLVFNRLPKETSLFVVVDEQCPFGSGVRKPFCNPSQAGGGADADNCRSQRRRGLNLSSMHLL